jgi:uncharacterized protein (TIGR02246 family)
MKRAMAVPAVLSLTAVLIAVAATQESDLVAEVLAAGRGTEAAWAAGDVAMFMTHFDPNVDGYEPDAGLLVGPTTAAEMQALFDSGFKADMESRHTRVRVYGDDTAVLTAYSTGTMTGPDGSSMSGTWRFTEVRVKRDDGWKIVHYHFSPLTTAVVETPPTGAPE